MRKKKVLMLGAGPLQVPAIQELKKMDTYVICLDQNPKAVGFLYADEAKRISTLDVDAICEEFQRQRADVVMTAASDAPVRVVSEVYERMGLSGALSYKDACAVTIKSNMRERLKENGLPIPKFRVIRNAEELFDVFYNVFAQRCIIKPSDNAGSRGVKLLEGQYNREGLDKEYNACIKYARNGILLAEEAMEGPEISVEALTVKGQTQVIAITDKFVCKKPFCVEIGHLEPSCLPLGVRQQIAKITRQAVKAMHIENGSSHTEMIVTRDGPKIVEIAARLGGDFITSALVPLSTGVNMIRESVRLSLGEEASVCKKWNRGAAITFFSSQAEGIFIQAEGMQEINELAGIQEVCLYVNPGEKVHVLRSSSDRIGHIIASGRNASEAWELVQEAYNRVHIILKEKYDDTIQHTVH